MKFKIKFTRVMEHEFDGRDIADAASWAAAFVSGWPAGEYTLLSIHKDGYVQPADDKPADDKKLKPYTKAEMLALGLLGNIKRLTQQPEPPIPGGI